MSRRPASSSDVIGLGASSGAGAGGAAAAGAGDLAGRPAPACPCAPASSSAVSIACGLLLISSKLKLRISMRLAVFGDLEVGRLEAADDGAVVVADDHVDRDELRVGAEHRPRILGLPFDCARAAPSLSRGCAAGTAAQSAAASVASQKMRFIRIGTGN